MTAHNKSKSDLSFLVTRAKSGDADAFSHLYERYLTPIFRFIYFRVKRREDVEDLTQTVFMKAWNALPDFQERGSPFSSWLYAIARNAVIDHWRKKEDIIFDNQADTLRHIEDKDKAANPFSVVEKEEKKRAVRQAIGTLTDDQQEIVILKFIEDLSNKEIAEVTAKTEEAVRQLQCRALKELRQYFKSSKTI